MVRKNKQQASEKLDRRSLCDIAELEFPYQMSDKMIDMSIEYDEYLENFKAISINF